MIAERSPLELLLAYAICFAAGMIATVALGAYTNNIKKTQFVKE